MTAYMDHKDLTSESIDETRATQIRDGVHRVLDAIAEAESAAGCAPGSVKLLAATKTRDVGEIMAAIDAGIRMIGENRPQEVMAKAEGLRRLCADRGFALGTGDGDTTRPSDAEHIPFHLIGQLQANKIGKILPDVNTIESVDGVELAQRIARRAVARGITVGVLLEVNESGEASKSGCDPQAAVDIAAQIAQAKTMLPEGHTFKSVGRYQIEEDVPAGNSAFNRNKTFGQQHTSFVVRFTEDGKETESSAGKTSYIYYEAEVTVEPDGTLSIEEN